METLDATFHGEPAQAAVLESLTTIALRVADGRRVRVRRLRRAEEAPIRELHASLSLQSRYFRFLSPIATLPESLVRQLADVDGRRRVALVAEAGHGGETIALASFDAIDDKTVELGLAVRDDWQRQRLGTELAVRLLDAAEACGYRRFVASTATGNTAIRRLIARIATVVSSTYHDGITELTFVRRRAS